MRFRIFNLKQFSRFDDRRISVSKSIYYWNRQFGDETKSQNAISFVSFGNWSATTMSTLFFWFAQKCFCAFVTDKRFVEYAHRMNFQIWQENKTVVMCSLTLTLTHDTHSHLTTLTSSQNTIQHMHNNPLTSPSNCSGGKYKKQQQQDNRNGHLNIQHLSIDRERERRMV